MLHTVLQLMNDRGVNVFRTSLRKIQSSSCIIISSLRSSKHIHERHGLHIHASKFRIHIEQCWMIYNISNTSTFARNFHSPFMLETCSWIRLNTIRKPRHLSRIRNFYPWSIISPNKHSTSLVIDFLRAITCLHQRPNLRTLLSRNSPPSSEDTGDSFP